VEVSESLTNAAKAVPAQLGTAPGPAGPLGRPQEAAEARVAESHPFVTVIIPARNEAPRIGECLQALNRGTYPKDRLEILVLDGESDDGTPGVVMDFAAAGLPVRVVNNPRRSRCAALNLGISMARGEVIMRIDARNYVPPDYISRCVRTLLSTDAWNVGGVLRALYKNVTQQAIGLAMSHPFGVGNAQFRLGRRAGDVDTIYLGCFRREVFSRVGLFDDDAPVLSEDTDMNQRIHDSGGKLYLNPEIDVFYYPRETMQDLAKLYFRYGGARAGNLLKHGKLTSVRQLVPLAFVTGTLAAGMLAPLSAWFLAMFAASTGLYLAVNAAVSVYFGIRHKGLSLIPRLLVAFPCMHFCWTFGFFRRIAQGRGHTRHWGY